jgi:hypothetical protein
MSKKVLLCLAVVLTACNQEVKPQNPSERTSQVYGHGTVSCPKVIEGLDQDKEMAKFEHQTPWRGLVYNAWVSGYITGVPDLKIKDADSRDAYIEKYCRDHPLSTLINAAQSLVNDLALEKETTSESKPAKTHK